MTIGVQFSYAYSTHYGAGIYLSLKFYNFADYPSGDGLQATTLCLGRQSPNEVEKIGDVEFRHFSRLETAIFGYFRRVQFLVGSK